ncbi:hypothetical protein CORC01_02409 [Colletotrichum orchidophilum]|uniref:Uncharacterized protein n=1 Tax=Colletotrichum orchidophilum TaxID=1209926 RepID=A0A1G4BM83_9PEZI|nr:uncharacterized protein CORC01_02409 [Colletotrichum orchidophilum]OHF02416.1 hypothetical protein CORC01_02409 [Colletotrichum orchidophilum]
MVVVVVCDPFLAVSHRPITSCPWTIPSVPPSAEGDPVNDEATACHRTNRGLMSYPPPKRRRNGVRGGSREKYKRAQLERVDFVHFFFLSHHQFWTILKLP